MTEPLALAMEVRSVDVAARNIVGRCVPYDEVSLSHPPPSGERVLRGAFTKSIAQRAGKIFLYRCHDHSHPTGRAVSFEEQADGLVGTFEVRASTFGDEVLAEVQDGYLPGLSCGFRPLQIRRAKDGVREVVEGALMEVPWSPCPPMTRPKCWPSAKRRTFPP